MNLSKFFSLLKAPSKSKFYYIERFLATPKLNVWKTLYVNFRAFGIKDALKFPILIYGPFKIYALGTIKLDIPTIRRGIIRIGRTNIKTYTKTKINNRGTIVFRGACHIWGGAYLELGRHATLELGAHTLLGENVRILLQEYCRIGPYARIAFDTLFMDSDFHYMVHVDSGEIRNCHAPIIIGACNWIGNKTTVKKGTVTPDYTIVAAPNAMLNKDYTAITSAYPILGGSPAKEIAHGWRRIFSNSAQNDLTEFFQSGDHIYRLDLAQTDIDSYCTNNVIP